MLSSAEHSASSQNVVGGRFRRGSEVRPQAPSSLETKKAELSNFFRMRCHTDGFVSCLKYQSFQDYQTPYSKGSIRSSSTKLNTSWLACAHQHPELALPPLSQHSGCIVFHNRLVLCVCVCFFRISFYAPEKRLLNLLRKIRKKKGRKNHLCALS